MKKRIINFLLILIMTVSLSGCGIFDTVGGLVDDKGTSFSDFNDLESGNAYVWHHEGAKIKDDLKSAADKDIFFTCITGDYNFKNKELEEVTEYPRSIWIDSDTDIQIPTVTSSDCLVYVSSAEVPDSIVFERFADYGYTIGVSNMQADLGGHYFLVYADTDEDDYKYYIDTKSDAANLTDLEIIKKLYLNKAGSVKVDKNTVSDGGTVIGLKKNKSYACEFYTGTYYQDYTLKANIHSFGSMERFVSYDYEFMHSNFIVIQIPEYFKSGYYFVNGVGLFRYVSDEDAAKYNGEAYDESIDWNDPIILYHEDGTVRYDPSDPDSVKVVDDISDPGDEGDVNIDVSAPVNNTEKIDGSGENRKNRRQQDNE
jgi:hypothetical protein